MSTPTYGIVGAGKSFISGRGISGAFQPAGLNSILQQQPSILLGGILPLTNVTSFRIGKSKQELKYRSFEGFFLAHQRATQDDVAIQIICKFTGPDRWWKLVLLDLLYRFGKQPTTSSTASTTAGLTLRETRKLVGNIGGKQQGTGKLDVLKQFRGFPITSKYLIIPLVIIETYSYSINANEKDTFDVRILVRKLKTIPKPPRARESSSRWKRFKTVARATIENIWQDLSEVVGLMANAGIQIGLELANQRILTMSTAYLQLQTPKKVTNPNLSRSVTLPLTTSDSYDLGENIEIHPTLVGDDEKEIKIHSLDTIKSDAGNPNIHVQQRTVSGDLRTITIEKEPTNVVNWIKLEGEPQSFPGIPWKFDLDLTNEGAENVYIATLSFHENWTFDMYGDETLNQYFTLNITDSSEETIYFSQKVIPGLAYTINDDVSICFSRLKADNYVTQGKHNLGCYINVATS